VAALALLPAAAPAAPPQAERPEQAAAAQSPPEARFGWAGDIAFSTRHGLPRDPDGVFRSVAPWLKRPGLTLGNLEGTLGRGGPSKCGGAKPTTAKPTTARPTAAKTTPREGSRKDVTSAGNCHAFQAPTSYAGVLKRAGFGLMNLANNHSRDFGASGLNQTRAALRRSKLPYTGLPNQIRYRKVDGVTTAFLGFAPYPWASSLTDIPNARRLVKRAGRKANLVIVMMHAGAEGASETHTPRGAETAFGENRGRTRAFSHAVVTAGADAVLGSGPHVLRGIECFRRRPIAYSLGNFVGYNTLSTGGVLSLSGVLRIRLNGDTGRLIDGRLFPVRLAPPGSPRRDSSRASIRLVRRLSRQDFGKRACKIGPRGKITLP
jgi:hypothetical protein